MARPDAGFRDEVERFEGTPATKGVAYWNSLRLRLSANRGDTSLESRAYTLERSPRQMAALVTDLDNVDPYLVASLAGSRALQDLSGVRPAAGRSDDPPTMLELVARESAERHWNRCRTEPVEAKRSEARWAGQREALRAGHLGPAFAALDATYGAACNVERQAALNQHPTVAPQAAYRPLGSYRLPGMPSERWNSLCARAAVTAERPNNWGPAADSSKHQRPRLEFIARGAARGTQLAGRAFSSRVLVTEVVLRIQLRRALRKGPVATRRLMTSVASNPRRMAAAIRGRLDPVIVASAIGPEAVKNMLSGRKVHYPGPVGRFHEALERAETDRLAVVRSGPDGNYPRGVTPDMQLRALEGGLQGNRRIQDLTRPVVERVWTGSTLKEAGLPAGESPYDAWRQRRAFVASGMVQAEIGVALKSQVDALDRSRGSSPADRDAERGQDWRGGETGGRPRGGGPAADDPPSGLDEPRDRPDFDPVDSPRDTAAALDSARDVAQVLLDRDLDPILESPAAWTILTNGAMIHESATVHPTATIGAKAVIGPDSFVAAEAVVGSNARVMDCELGPGARVGPDARVLAATVGDRARIQTGATLHHASVGPDTSVGRNSYLGRDAVVASGATVGDEAYVGGRVLVGKDANVGSKAHLVGSWGWGEDAPRTTVGPGAVVGAAAVVGQGSDLKAGSRVPPSGRLPAGSTMESSPQDRGRVDPPPKTPDPQPRSTSGPSNPPPPKDPPQPPPKTPDPQPRSSSGPSSPPPPPKDPPQPPPKTPDPRPRSSSDTSGPSPSGTSGPKPESGVPAMTLEDPSPGRPPVHPKNVSFVPPAPGEPTGSFEPRFTIPPPAQVSGSPERSGRNVAPHHLDAPVTPGQEGRFTLEDDGSWKAHGDPEVDRVVPKPDGAYVVKFHRGLPLGSALVDGSAAWAAAQVHNRATKPFDHDLAREQAAAFDAAHPDHPHSGPGKEKSPVPSDKSRGPSGGPDSDDDGVLRAQQAAAQAARQRAAGGPGQETPPDSDRPPPTSTLPSYGPSDSTQATVNVPGAAVAGVRIPESELPTLIPLSDGSFKVHKDPYVDRVIPRPDGSFDVVLNEGVAPAVRSPGDSPDKPSGFEVVADGQKQRAQDLNTAVVDPFPDAFAAGTSSLDSERRSVDSALAFNPASAHRFDGVDGQMLRTQASSLGSPDDARFATREEIEAAGGKVREDAPGVRLMVEQSVSTQPLGVDGKPDPAQPAVSYGVQAPVVLYHVSSQTDPAPNMPATMPPQERKLALDPRDLPASLGLETKEVPNLKSTTYDHARDLPGPDGKPVAHHADRVELAPNEPRQERKSRLIDATVAAAVYRVNSTDGPHPSKAPEGTYPDVSKRDTHTALVERLAADRVASRIGSAYTPRPLPAGERAAMAEIVKDPKEFKKLSREADRVASWVVDGAKDRLHERGRQTVQERRDDFAGSGPGGAKQPQPKARETADKTQEKASQSR